MVVWEGCVEGDVGSSVNCGGIVGKILIEGRDSGRL